MPYGERSEAVIREHYGAIVAGGFLLALLAGFINTAMLEFYHQSVSHMSGTIAKIGLDLGTGDRGEFTVVVRVLMAFFTGAVFCGVVVGTNAFTHSYRYAIVLLVEAAALMAAALMLHHGTYSVLLTAFACGLQNAMASSWHGLTLRTTHMTGVLTDLGFLTSELFRLRRPQWRKIVLLLAFLFGFIGGCALSALSYSRGFNQLYAASAFCGTLALTYLWFMSRTGGGVRY